MGSSEPFGGPKHRRLGLRHGHVQSEDQASPVTMLLSVYKLGGLFVWSGGDAQNPFWSGPFNEKRRQKFWML